MKENTFFQELIAPLYLLQSCGDTPSEYNKTKKITDNNFIVSSFPKEILIEDLRENKKKYIKLKILSFRS